MKFLGCLFVIVFGAILFAVGMLRSLFFMLFGKRPGNSWTTFGNTMRGGTGNPFGANGRQQDSYNSNQTNTEQQANGAQYTSGNAHHEANGANGANGQPRRNGKIFEKNEGKYIDFEEV